MLSLVPILVGFTVVWAAATKRHEIASVLWGLLTTLFFAPAGALFALIVSERTLLGALALALISLSGLVLGVRLLGCAHRMSRGDASTMASVGRASLAHHALVPVAVAAGMYAHEGIESTMVILLPTSIACAIGAFAGWRLLDQGASKLLPQTST